MVTARRLSAASGAWTLLAWALAAEAVLAGTSWAPRVVSSRDDTVSGGDALVQLWLGVDSHWTAYLNGVDVSASFKAAPSSEYLLGYLTGLELGENLLEIRSGSRTLARQLLLNHPRSGPIFSGPHQTPFICQTTENGLGPARDENCDSPMVVQYYYKSTQPISYGASSLSQGSPNLLPGFQIYHPGSDPPDIADTTTSEGRRVKYIVRRELGILNRAVYEIRFLQDPNMPVPTPWMRSNSGWNGRLVFNFGAGCDAGYRQGVLLPSTPTDERLISRGYAWATSTLTNFGTTCNDRVSAETLSMVKETFIERYGRPAQTIGIGSSGGAIQQHLIAQNYPGLLDGIIVSASFPDVTTYAQTWTDCRLLAHAFRHARLVWTDAQKTAVSGLATWRACVMAEVPLARPWIHSSSCPSVLPKEFVYDPSTRPHGVRCDIYSNEISVFGRDPRTHRARRPIDNVGVQYGLRAFNDGAISPAQFIELNEHIGGYDADGNFIETRTMASAETIALMYERGLVLTGGGGLAHLPIIDWRQYSDDLADNHDRFRSLATRARLIAATGSAQNQAILVFPRPEFLPLVGGANSPLANDYHAMLADRVQLLVLQMDRWLANISEDHASGSLAQKVARARPSDLADGCWTTAGERIIEPADSQQGRCNQLYPPHADPRRAAGAPPTDDVLKCALKPLDSRDYTHALSTEQLQRLQRIFPSGVCDYAKPGVGQRVTQRTWQRFTKAPPSGEGDTSAIPPSLSLGTARRN